MGNVEKMGFKVLLQITCITAKCNSNATQCYHQPHMF